MCLSVRIISSGTRSESPLFCTPPPSDALEALTQLVDSEVFSGLDYLDFVTADRSDTEVTARVYARGLVSNLKKTRQPQTREYEYYRESGISNTDTLEASLTLAEYSPAKRPARARIDLLVDHNLKPHSPVPPMASEGQVPSTLSNSNLPQVYSSLSQLTGYATSEDDEAQNILVPPDQRHTTSRQARIHKPGEHIVDNTSSDADAKRGLRKQSLTHSMLGSQGLSEETNFRGTHSMNGNKVGTTMPKGAYDAAAPTNRKPPKTKGGFVLSDESETEDHEAVADQRERHTPSTISNLNAPKLPKRHPGASTDKRTVNTKQVNKSRLSKLLGRQKSPFHHGPPKALSSPRGLSISSSSCPPSRRGTPASIDPFDPSSPSQAHGSQSNVSQCIQPKLGTITDPQALKTSGFEISPAPRVVSDKATARSLFMSTLQDAKAGSSSPSPQAQQHISKDGTVTSPTLSDSSVLSKTISSKRTKQPLHRRPAPPATAGEYKPSGRSSKREQLLRDEMKDQQQERKSNSQITTAKPLGLEPQSVQKRKVEDMVSDLGEGVAPPKKRSVMSVGRYDDPGNRRDVVRASKLPTDDDKSPPDTAVIGALMAPSSKPAKSTEIVSFTKSSLLPDSRSLNVVPPASATMKTSMIASSLRTEDASNMRASATSAENEQAFSILPPVVPNHCSTDKTTPRMESDPIPVLTAVHQDPTTNRSAETQHHIVSIEPGCETSHIDPSRQGRAQDPMNKPQEIQLLPMAGSADAEPYFEYSIFERRWSDQQDEYDVKEVGVILRPFIDVNEANNQVEQLFQRVREDDVWQTQNTLSDWTSKRDEYGCLICKASFAKFDNPYQEHFVKIWVQRDYVSKLANQTAQELKPTSFISSTAYILRLFKIVTPFEGSDTEGTVEDACSPIRIYQPLIRSEVYTTLYMANRAARDQQLELSHEKDPKNLLTLKWQEQNLKALNEKLRALSSTKDSEGVCWESRFNGYGMGGDQFELLVEKAGICGPRNL